MRFYLLGRLRNEAEPGEKTAPAELRLRKGQGLLAYLLLFRSQAHPREHLASLFWGDVPEARARDSLSTTLKAIRAWLPGTGLALASDRNTVQLDLGTAWLDVAELEAGLAPDANSVCRGTALSLYTADLLVDW